ncbi:MAG: hypothetical protein DYG89_33060 [Caldilinea sp. CFX5]|nr:hypothetical protein [Caldilinea sp. CFX5]
MGKQIRRTITITLTETWTFIWAATDAVPAQTITVEQAIPAEEQQEEQDASLQLPVSTIDPANPNACEPTALPHPLETPVEPPSDGAPTSASARRPRKRARRRIRRNPSSR